MDGNGSDNLNAGSGKETGQHGAEATVSAVSRVPTSKAPAAVHHRQPPSAPPTSNFEQRQQSENSSSGTPPDTTRPRQCPLRSHPREASSTVQTAPPVAAGSTAQPGCAGRAKRSTTAATATRVVATTPARGTSTHGLAEGSRGASVHARERLYALCVRLNREGVLQEHSIVHSSHSTRCMMRSTHVDLVATRTLTTSNSLLVLSRTWFCRPFHGQAVAWLGGLSP